MSGHGLATLRFVWGSHTGKQFATSHPFIAFADRVVLLNSLAIQAGHGKLQATSPIVIVRLRVWKLKSLHVSIVPLLVASAGLCK